MPVYVESGLRVTLPDGLCFRFQDSPTYRNRLGSRGVKEMDFAYWDSTRAELVLLEVKDYRAQVAPTHLADTLIQKGRDALVMMHGVYRGAATGTGAASDLLSSLREDIPSILRTDAPIRPCFVLHGDTRALAPTMGPIRDKLAWSLRSYAELLGLRLRQPALLDDAAAAKKFGVLSPEP